MRLSRSMILEENAMLESKDREGTPSHEWMGRNLKVKKNGNSEGSSSIPSRVPSHPHSQLLFIS